MSQGILVRSDEECMHSSCIKGKKKMTPHYRWHRSAAMFHCFLRWISYFSHYKEVMIVRTEMGFFPHPIKSFLAVFIHI